MNPLRLRELLPEPSCCGAFTETDEFIPAIAGVIAILKSMNERRKNNTKKRLFAIYFGIKSITSQNIGPKKTIFIINGFQFMSIPE